MDRTLESRITWLVQSAMHGGLIGVSDGTLVTLESYYADVKRVGERDEEYAERMLPIIREVLEAAEVGRDALSGKRGFFWRGYRSRYSSVPQMYSIYVPENYDGTRPIPLIVTLHGGSSNHNVWMALSLGNIIETKDYWRSFRSRFEPKLHPDAIVVAPDGLGQLRWRWQAEEDVFDVIDDVRRAYNIDNNKIFLTGLSNGGIGSYTIGLKHAWRFAGVLPLAGVTDWLTHYEAEGRHRPAERVVLANESAITFAENAFNTNLRFFHGTKDPGFKVDQARLLAEKLAKLRVPFRYGEYELGHDLLHVLWRKLRIMKYVQSDTRKVAPTEVRLVATSARANRQFWLVLDDVTDHTRPGILRARVERPDEIAVETRNAARFTILLDEAPVTSPVTVRVNGRLAYEGPVPSDNRLSLARIHTRLDDTESVRPWSIWDGKMPTPGTRKIFGLSGPLHDASYEPQVHVYGTLSKEDEPLLRKAAELGARAWIPARDYTYVRQPVISDRNLTWRMMNERVVVLYGNARNNSVLAEIGDRLPIRVGEDHLMLRDRRIDHPSAGARFVCPNPLVTGKYLVVQAGVTAQAVEQGGRLPLYLADYIVYDARTTDRRAFMILGSRKEIETGFFTEDWRLP